MSKSEQLPGETLSGEMKFVSGKWNYSITQIPEYALSLSLSLSSRGTFSITTMGIVFHERRWKITFRSRAIVPSRAVAYSACGLAILATARSQPPASRPNPPRVWDPWKFAASRPTSAKWMHKFLVVCFRRTAVTAANAITRRVSLCFTTHHLGVSPVNGLINRRRV